MDSVEYSFNVFNILIICGSIQGLIFSTIVLSSKKYKQKTFRYLAFLILALSLSNAYYWFRDTGLAILWEHYRVLYVPWDLLILPLFYFFVSTFLGIKKGYEKYLFIPFFIRLVAQVIKLLYQYTTLSNFKISDETLFILKRFDEYGTIAFMLVMLLLILKLVFGYDNNKTLSNHLQKPTKWLKQLLIFGISISLLWFVMVFLGDTTLPNLSSRSKYYFIWIGLSVLVYWLGYLGVYHLGIFNQRTQVRKALESTMNLSSNSDAKHQKRFEDIDTIIKTEKLYLNPNLSLQSLAERFELSEGYLSQIVNSNVNSNFSDYINVLRIENAKTILINPSYKPYTIVAIALESGFNSKSTFYNAFKKHVGESPSMYRKTNMS